MALTRALLDPVLIYAATAGLGGAVSAAANIRTPFQSDRFPVNIVELVAVLGLATVASLAIGSQPIVTLAAGAFVVLLLVAAKLLLPQLTAAGAVQAASSVASLLVAGPWSYLLLQELGFPGWSLGVSAVGMVVGTLLFGFQFAGNLATQALLGQHHWRRPHAPLDPRPGREPKVSIHLACYSEPPELVIATIDRIAALDYTNYELLVCDNNTADEALWRPVEAHIRRLNQRHAIDRFKFFHVRPIGGAKAGALNWLRPHTAPDADLIAVLDADYLSRPDFLSRLVGYFDDPALGYIQTPHDYRDYGASAYLTGCYWEYMPSNKVDMAGVNEYGAPFTIGTMCIIRTAALDAVGGWAEWCLTEDSEVSVRIRALGWTGLYLRDTFGRGLIPETFEDYKKQRFRWTAGPVQQLRRYWRMYLPGPLGVPSGLSGWSKLLEFQRSMAPLGSALGAATGALFVLLFGVGTSAGHVPDFAMPAAGWAAMAIGFARALVVQWHRYRLTGCERIADMLLGEIARASLAYVSMLGGVAGLSKRPLGWRRTPKFAATSAGWRAFASVAPETVLGLAHLIVLQQILFADAIGSDLKLLMGAAVAASAARFLAAPAMAILAEGALRKGAAEEEPALILASEKA